MAIPDGEVTGPGVKRGGGGSPYRRRAPILVVDDDPANRIAFEAVLQDPRHDLVLVSSGQEALDAAQKTEFAAILLDVRMPGLGGYDTAALLRRRPRTKSTPIIFTTAYDTSSREVSDAYSVGGTDFLHKPVDDVILRRKVEGFVDVYFDRVEASEWAKELTEAADRRLRLILEQMPVNLCTVNRDLRITFADGMHVRLLGRSGSEIVGRLVTDFANDAERPMVEKAFREAIQGRPSSYETHFEGYTYSAHVQPLVDRDRSIIGAVCGFIDVTAQKNAEREAAQNENLLEALFHAASDMVFVKDASGRYLLVNEAGARMFGKSVEGVLGKTDAEVLPAGAVRECRESDRKVLESGTPLVAEERAEMPDGSHVCRVSKAPLRDAEGRVMGVVGIVHDFTDLARAQENLAQLNLELEGRVADRTRELRGSEERLKLALEESEAFARNVAHELRGPLRAMGVTAEMLLEESSRKGLDAEARKAFDHLIGSARRLDAMTQGLLEYSRLAQSELPMGPVDVAAVVSSVLSEMQGLLSGWRAKVDLRGPFGVVRGNDQILSRAVSNLITNAIKFVAPGTTPRVRVVGEVGRGTRRLWVEDNGIGIRPEDQARIFRVFERLSTEYPGSGIGLAMVRKGIERMGGRVGVVSDPGKGSRFWIELPSVYETGDPD